VKRRVFVIILALSTFFWTGVFFVKRSWSDHQRSSCQDPRWTIRRIASHPQSEYRLPHALLTQLLGITPTTSLYAIDCKELAKRLLTTEIFEKVHVSRAPPSTLYVSYCLKRPVAQLATVQNIGIDAQGEIFPLYPFYAPLFLPSFVVPVSDSSSLTELQECLRSRKEMKVGLELLSLLQRVCRQHRLHLSTIDLSRSTHESFFRREIIVTLSSSKGGLIYLRLNKDLSEIPTVLAQLFPRLNMTKSGTIDLRFTGSALVSEELL